MKPHSVKNIVSLSEMSGINVPDVMLCIYRIGLLDGAADERTKIDQEGNQEEGKDGRKLGRWGRYWRGRFRAHSINLAKLRRALADMFRVPMEHHLFFRSRFLPRAIKAAEIAGDEGLLSVLRRIEHDISLGKIALPMGGPRCKWARWPKENRNHK